MTVALALIDRDDVPSDRVSGGVELLFSRLEDAASDTDVDVVRNPTPDELTRLARRGPVVAFTQQEGRLSRPYRAWADRCLAEGIVIVEKNVFALASPYRPSHPDYVHALMSVDGAHRFAWRSRAAGLRAPQRYLLLPNPYLLPHSDAPGRVSPDAPRRDVIRLLRVGRPDPVKWSPWEQQLAAAMVQARPGLRIELRLVGAPQECLLPPGALPDGVRVRVEPPISPAELVEAYAGADAYVHASRIGETHGNTIVEAQAAGCFCIVGLDPAWDCAPLGLLDPAASWVGAPARVLADAGRVADALIEHRVRAGVMVAGTLQDHLGRLLGLVDGSTRLDDLPSTRGAGAYLRGVGTRLDGRRGAMRAPAIEAARAIKGRVVTGRRAR